MYFDNSAAIVIDAAGVAGSPGLKLTSGVNTRSKSVAQSVLRYLDALQLEPTEGYLIVYVQRHKKTPIEVCEHLELTWKKAGFETRWSECNADDMIVTDVNNGLMVQLESPLPRTLVLVSSDRRLAKRVESATAGINRVFCHIDGCSTKRCRSVTTLEQIISTYSRLPLSTALPCPAH